MKRLAICISLFLTLAGLASGAQQKIAFERGDNVWIANLDGSDAKKVAAGSLPNISPDATRLAFNTSEDSKTRPGPNVTLPSPISRAAKSQSSKTFQATIALARSGRR